MTCHLSKSVGFLLYPLIAVLLLAVGYVHAADSQTQSSPTTAVKIYKSVGPNGNVTYSDHPSPGSSEMSVQPGEGYHPVTPPTGFTPYTEPKKSSKKSASAESITITSPANKANIWSGPGNLTVSVKLGSALQDGQQLQYQIDGKTVYTGTSASQNFSNIYRGAHVITVQITGGIGAGISSQPVTVYMHRPFKKK